MKRSVPLAVVGVAMLGSAFVAPAAAHAALSECNSNHMCIWGNNDYQWLIGERYHGGGITDLSGDRNNQMDSWANRSATYTGCMFSGANGSGDRQTMARNSSDNNVASWNSDEVSSWRTSSGC